MEKFKDKCEYEMGEEEEALGNLEKGILILEEKVGDQH